MAEENNADQEKQNSEETNGYEGILDDFSNIFDDDAEKSDESPVDHNGLALSEIIGEDVTEDTQAEKSVEPETVQQEESSDFTIESEESADEETSEIELNIETDEEEAVAPMGEESLSDEDTVTPEPETPAPGAETADFGLDAIISDSDETAPESEEGFVGSETVIEEADAESEDGYASILGELDEDTGAGEAKVSDKEEEQVLDAEDSEELSFVELDSSEESEEEPLFQEDATGIETPEPSEGEPEKEPEEDSDFVELDLGIDDDEEVESPVSEEESAVTVAVPESDEDDFLGLSSPPAEGEAGSFEAGGGAGAFTEVLFEGIEMEFDEQVSLVTRAEILLAQKKDDEASELFKQVAEKKGQTHWVSKRLKLFS